MNWTLELLLVPVTDVSRAKAFYADQVGFHVDFDHVLGAAGRLIQLTPPGSGCSIALGVADHRAMPPGTLQGPQLVVPDIRAARAELVERGVDVSEVQVVGPTGSRPAEDDETGTRLDNVGFVHFADPDGNGWTVQQISSRA